MQIFYTPDIAVNTELPDEEGQHAIRVLRLNEGAEILLTDGKGRFYKAAIALPMLSIVVLIYSNNGRQANYGTLRCI